MVIVLNPLEAGVLVNGASVSFEDAEHEIAPIGGDDKRNGEGGFLLMQVERNVLKHSPGNGLKA